MTKGTQYIIKSTKYDKKITIYGICGSGYFGRIRIMINPDQKQDQTISTIKKVSLLQNQGCGFGFGQIRVFFIGPGSFFFYKARIMMQLSEGLDQA